MGRKREAICELGYEDVIVFESPDYDDAIIGIDLTSERVVYDYEKMVEHLMSTDNLSYEDAVEFIDYNTIRACPYMGDKAPIILKNIEE